MSLPNLITVSVQPDTNTSIKILRQKWVGMKCVRSTVGIAHGNHDGERCGHYQHESIAKVETIPSEELQVLLSTY